MIEKYVADRIKTLCDGRVKPAYPTENIQLPFLVYTIQSSKPEISTTGDVGLTNSTLQIDVESLTSDEALSLANSVKTLLHCYKTQNIKGCFLTSQTTEQEEIGYHITMSFNLWTT